MPFVFVIDDNNELNKAKTVNNWWKPAVQIFSQVSTWIVVPIVLALIAGKALDNNFGTTPWIFLGLASIGFLISSYGIIRIVQKYLKEIKDISEEKEKDLK